MLGNYLQQTTSADVIFQMHLKVKNEFLSRMIDLTLTDPDEMLHNVAFIRVSTVYQSTRWVVPGL